MRKIQSKYERERHRTRNQLILGVLLIFVMLFSIVGFGFVGRTPTQNSGNKISYNGYEFVNQNGLWVLEIENSVFVFRYNPQQVDKIDSYVSPLNSYYNKPLYVYSESPDAETEIHVNLGGFASRIQSACLESEQCDNENLPIKTCEDNFIIIRESNTTDIIQQNNCVFIQGPLYRLTQLTDGFLFKVLGVE